MKPIRLLRKQPEITAIRFTDSVDVLDIIGFLPHGWSAFLHPSPRRIDLCHSHGCTLCLHAGDWLTKDELGAISVMSHAERTAKWTTPWF